MQPSRDAYASNGILKAGSSKNHVGPKQSALVTPAIASAFPPLLTHQVCLALESTTQPTRSYICTQARELDVRVPATVVDSPTRRKRPRPQAPTVAAAVALAFDEGSCEEVVREHVSASRGMRLLAKKTKGAAVGTGFGVVNTLLRKAAPAARQAPSSASGCSTTAAPSFGLSRALSSGAALAPEPLSNSSDSSRFGLGSVAAVPGAAKTVFTTTTTSSIAKSTLKGSGTAQTKPVFGELWKARVHQAQQISGGQEEAAAVIAEQSATVRAAPSAATLPPTTAPPTTQPEIVELPTEYVAEAARTKPSKRLKAGEVSDNFVRLNLKRKGMFKYKKRKVSNPRAMARLEGFKEMRRGNGHKTWQREDSSGTSQPLGGSISRYGLDPLDGALDLVLPQGQRSDHDQTDGTTSAATGASTTARVIDRDDLLRLRAVKCPRHNMPCKLLTTKKPGPNKGRQFYVCSFPAGQRCDFFMWADDNPELVAAGSRLSWQQRREAAIRKQYQALTVPELKAQLRRCGLPVGGGKSELVGRLVETMVARLPTAEPTGGAPDNPPAEQNKFDEPPEQDTDDDGDGNAVEDGDNDDKSSASSLELDFGDNGDEQHADEEVELSETEEEEEQEQEQAEEEASDEEEEQPLRAAYGRRRLATTASGAGGTTNRQFKVQEALKDVFGFTQFRPGQEWAIERCLAGKRSMLVLPTGHGKSLCYLVPALCTSGLTVVVSPLISLMEDQMARLPPELPGVCLSGSLSTQRLAGMVDDVVSRRVKILFISPERLCTPSFRRMVTTCPSFPEVALLCVDEAHCLSQWSHNFRPSYIQMRKQIELLNPASVLALTATATPAVIADVCSRLNIDPTDGVLAHAVGRDNITMHAQLCATDEERRQAALKLIVEAPHLKGSAVIVYVWQQRDAEAMATFFQAHDVKALPYHAGMSSGQRSKVQTQFLRSKVRVVVATIAFGLGVDKADVRGVIHMHLPRSVENYVQEVGRAGRDGKPAHAHLLYTVDDVVKHRSLCFATHVTKYQATRLLQHIFAPGNPQKAISLPAMEAQLGLRSAVVETIVCFLEEQGVLRSITSLYDKCEVAFRTNPARFSEQNPILKDICARMVVNSKQPEVDGEFDGDNDRQHRQDQPQQQQEYSYGWGKAVVSLVNCAQAAHADVQSVTRYLYSLQAGGAIEYKLSELSLHVECLLYPRDASAAKLAELSDRVFEYMGQAELASAAKVEHMFRLASCLQQATTEPASQHALQQLLHVYFTEPEQLVDPPKETTTTVDEASGDRDSSQSSSDAIVAAFRACVLPTRSINSLTSFEKAAIVQDAVTLVSDPQLLEAARKICQSGLDAGLVAWLCCSVFQGLHSASMPLALWRESCFWQRYMSIRSEELTAFLQTAVQTRLVRR